MFLAGVLLVDLSVTGSQCALLRGTIFSRDTLTIFASSSGFDKGRYYFRRVADYLSFSVSL